MDFRIRRDERSFVRLLSTLTAGGEYRREELCETWCLPPAAWGVVEVAAKTMEESARFGRLRASPVYYVKILFPADLDRRKSLRIAHLILDALGLVWHEVVMLGRGRDLHLVINRVHPDTGAVWLPVADRRRIASVLREEASRLGWEPPPSPIVAYPDAATRRRRGYSGRLRRRR